MASITMRDERKHIVQVMLAHNITGIILDLLWRVTLEDLHKMHIGSTMGEKKISSCQMGEVEV